VVNLVNCSRKNLEIPRKFPDVLPVLIVVILFYWGWGASPQ
jgi:hypothetical protein